MSIHEVNHQDTKDIYKILALQTGSTTFWHSQQDQDQILIKDRRFCCGRPFQSSKEIETTSRYVLLSISP